MLNYVMIAVMKMRIKKSEFESGWIGFYSNDENGVPEEFYSVRTIDSAQKIVNTLQKDIDRLKKVLPTKHNSRLKILKHH